MPSLPLSDYEVDAVPPCVCVPPVLATLEPLPPLTPPPERNILVLTVALFNNPLVD